MSAVALAAVTAAAAPGCAMEEPHRTTAVAIDVVTLEMDAASLRVVGEGRLRVRSDADEQVVVDDLELTLATDAFGSTPVDSDVRVALLDAGPMEVTDGRWSERRFRFDADSPVICPPERLHVLVRGTVLGEAGGTTTLRGGHTLEPGAGPGPSALPWAWASPVSDLAPDVDGVVMAPDGHGVVWALTARGEVARIDADGASIVRRLGAMDVAASRDAVFTVAHADGVDVLTRLDTAGTVVWDEPVPCQSSLLVALDDRVVIQGWAETPAMLGGVALEPYSSFLASFDAASGALLVVSTHPVSLADGAPVGDGRFIAAAGDAVVTVGPSLAIEAVAAGPAAELARSADGHVVTAVESVVSGRGPDLEVTWSTSPSCEPTSLGWGGLVALAGGGALSVQSGALVRVDGAGGVIGGAFAEGLHLVQQNGVVAGTWVEGDTRWVGRLDLAAIEGVVR